MNVPPLPSAAPKNSALAIASLVLGILGVICCSVITGVPAVICGHIARAKIKRDASLGGGSLALAGVILGYLSILIMVVGLVISWSTIKVGLEYGPVGLRVAQIQPIESAIAKIGYPADTGVKSVAALKEELIKSGISETQIEALDFSSFEFGNVSSSDPEGTILIRSREKGSRGVVIFIAKSGDIEVLPESEASSRVPQRDPAFLPEN